MQPPLRHVLALSTGLLLVATGATAAAASPSRPSLAPSLVRWTPGLLGGIPAFTQTTAVAPAQTVRVTIELTDPDAAGEAAYNKALYDPSSSTYHQFLTPTTFAAKFGVAQTTYDEALAFGTAHGMTLVSSTPWRDSLSFDGTAAQAEATYSTPLENFTYGGESFFANTLAPLVPAGLPISGIFGLQTLSRSKLPAKSATKTTPKQSVCEAGTCLGDVTPQDVWSMYDEPSTDEGQNQKIAIFGEGDFASSDTSKGVLLSDLKQFESENDLPQIPTKVNFAEGPNTGQYTSTDGDGEWQLDTQSSTGMAPLAKELDFEWGTDLNDQSTLDVVNEFVADPTLFAASASYSECEPTLGDIGGTEAQIPLPSTVANYELEYSTDAYVASYEQPLTAAVSMGKTLFSSSGDTGSSCGPLPVDANGLANEGIPGVGYPASSPNAVGVGGTVLYGKESTLTAPASNETRSDEYGWTFGGGGPSSLFHIPAYQVSDPAAVSGLGTAPAETPDVPCTTTLTGAADTSLTTCRKVPDVSAISGDIATNGYNIVDGGSDTATGGTSLSSPLTLGLWTRIESAYGDAGPGFANDTFYKYPADFFDPGGLTDSTPSTNGAYTSGPGYDYVTGLGVIDVAKMMLSVAGRTTPGPLEAAPPVSLPEAADPALLLLAGLAAASAGLAIRRRSRRQA